MEVPAPVWAALVGVMIALTAVANEWLQSKREARAGIAAKVAAAKVAEKVELVKDTLLVNSKVTDAKLDTIHTLVNSSMGAALKLNAELSRWKANAEPTKENNAAADLAEQVYREHQGKQSTVDAKDRQPTPN